MVVRHYLNGTEISEPIGFDNLKMKMKRGDYHGISAEVSEQALEFYGTAAEMIREAYSQDLDTVVTYSVTTDGEEMYSGVLDLSTYEEQRSDYCSVSCKVGEVGVKTTFNNRSEVEVSINGENGIDGNAIIAPTTIQTIIQPIPIIYTNKWECDKEVTNTHSGNQFTILPIFKTTVNEFGEHKLGTTTEISIQEGKSPIPIFETDTDHPTYDAEVRLKGTLTIEFENSHAGLYIYDKMIWNCSSGIFYLDHTFNFTDCKGSFNVYIYAFGGNVTITLSLTTDSYYKITSHDKTADKATSKVDTIPIISALDCICQKIAGIRVRSDWYKADFSNNEYGGGGLRAITTGYKLRRAERNFAKKDMFVSFKSMIEALSAVDCIGWCFTIEDGTTCIRVERWQWFYKTDDPILRITAPKEVKTAIDTSLIVSELTIGYKKYTSNEDISAIDSVHTERTFGSKLKAVQSAQKTLCDFIADPYAIELTRRKANEYNVSDWKYDENIFLFEIWHFKSSIGTGLVWYNGVFAAGKDAENMLAGTLLNASLSPRRNAERWKDYLFFVNKESDLAFSSGTGNYNGAYKNSSELNTYAFLSFSKLYRPADTDGSVIYEESTNYADLPLLKESEPITYKRGSLKAETIEFSYPLSVAEYKKVKANPYGLIEVDGVLGWIKEFTYSFVDGTATFKLIPKAD